MGSIVSIAAILSVDRLAKLHAAIKGKWISFLFALLQLKIHRRTSKPYFPKHDYKKNDAANSGVIPFIEEWENERPSKSKHENIFVYGVNSSGENIQISLKWRPQEDATSKAHVRFFLKDTKGDVYTLDEEEQVEMGKELREYKVAGIAFEVLCPMKRYRVKVRGYLKKNGKELVYARIRLLWLSLSNGFDMSYHYDDNFLAKEITNNPTSGKPFLETRYEQFGQLKGTVQIESQKSEEIFFWGARCKTHLPKVEQKIKKKIIRVMGFTKKGVYFHIGLVKIGEQNFYHHYGHAKWTFGAVKPLIDISKGNSDLGKLLSDESKISFNANFVDRKKEFLFEIMPKEKDENVRKVFIDGIEGRCLVIVDEDNEWQKEEIIQKTKFKSSDLVLPLSAEPALQVELTGGKGSSLANLMKLSSQLKKNNNPALFSVPNGLVVTTSAYNLLLRENKDLKSQIEKLQKLAWSEKRENLKNECENVINYLNNQKMPMKIKSEIESKLKSTFNEFSGKLFAVRSSAAGEDSEEMSAAGQMTTYLGVKGIDEICNSVMKCWSSQFGFVPVEYKRGYGQMINSPMAVVIQEMVNCDSAGVIFTADPINGDERLMTVTANYGLGETVVSASAEPDTIKLNVNIESNSTSKPRSIKGIDSKVIGTKKKVMKLNANGGTTEEDISDNTNCCVDDNELLRLGEIALKIHSFYGNARDIEWGIKDANIYMLQSRPITNLDNSFTEWEIMHEIDSGHHSEFEFYSRAHWGENFPGSSSYVTMGWNIKAIDAIMWRSAFGPINFNKDDFCPFIGLFGGIAYNQLFFSVKSGLFPILQDYPDTKMARGSVMSFFGHELDDPDVLEYCREQNKEKPPMGIFLKIMLLFMMPFLFFVPPRRLKKSMAEYIGSFNWLNDVKHLTRSKDILENILDCNHKIEIGSKNHGACSFGSGLKCTLLKSFLENAKKENPHLESDYQLMISSCNEVVSAEVPNELREIARSIKNAEEFMDLSDEEAVKKLRDGNHEASKKFALFIEKHGHRGYREFDPMYLPWRDNPIPVIKTIKMTLRGGQEALKKKEFKSIDDVMRELKTPLSSIRKFFIKNFLLPWARDSVGIRENSKYFMIWWYDQQRQVQWKLAKMMVQEGLIPDAESMFFLTSDEIQRLVEGERDALLLAKIRLRKRVYIKTNKYKFEEFIKGPKMIPRNLQDNSLKIDRSNGGLVRMTGTPVSGGKIRARICVSEDITEADAIQPGDILITYSTDIGWSPYFPMISGIVTEIGGTISHGAVIAREYGIPCLIAVENACHKFKTGDIAVLDADIGEIVKVE